MSSFEMRLHEEDDADERSPTRAPVADHRATHYAVAEIAGDAGWVGVDRSGALVEAEFDERRVRAMRPELLGGYLVAAVRRAEEMADQKRRDSIRRKETVGREHRI